MDCNEGKQVSVMVSIFSFIRSILTPLLFSYGLLNNTLDNDICSDGKKTSKVYFSHAECRGGTLQDAIMSHN